MRKMLFLTTSLVLLACNGGDTTTEAQIDFTANAKQLVLEEFQPSTLNQKEQLEELSWFTNAAEPFRGMTINVVSETLTTHEYESEVLTKAFYEITAHRSIINFEALVINFSTRETRCSPARHKQCFCL